MNVTFLYRGPLQDCNFDCTYCPFAHHRADPSQLQADKRALSRLTDWLESRTKHRFSLFFTPWGEALIWPHYQATLARLSRLSHIQTLAIQTNLSGDLSWLNKANPNRIALWCSYHPGQIPLQDFLSQVRCLRSHNIRFSVGIVGLRSHFQAIRDMRQALDPDIYLWINADKHQKTPYSDEELAFLRRVDPLFDFNRYHYRTRGQACRCGEQVLSLAGDGRLQRCHFIKEALGNIYEPGWANSLAAGPCSRDTCHCHIGYAHLPVLGLERVFGDGLLARIPAGYPGMEIPPIPQNLI